MGDSGPAMACIAVAAMSVLVMRLFSSLHNPRRHRRHAMRMHVRMPAAAGEPTFLAAPGSSTLSVHLLPLDMDACSAALCQILSRMLHGGSVGGVGAGSDLPLLGLDCEWQPEINRRQHSSRVSVIQLAGASDCVILQPLLLTARDEASHSHSHSPGVGGGGGAPSAAPADEGPAVSHSSGTSGDGQRGWQRPGCIPQALREVLESPRVIKAGVGIHEDVRRLRRDYGIDVKGVLELRHAALAIAPRHLSGGGSLKALAASVLGVTVDKRLQCSDWQRSDLSKAQLKYAALDAFISWRLAVALAAEHLDSLQQQPDPGASPPSARDRANSSAAVSAALAPPFASPAASFRSIFGSLLDQSQFRPGAGPGDSQPDPPLSGSHAAPGPGSATAAAAKLAKPLKPATTPLRKSLLYENCRLLAPDGAVLCTCSAKKVRWYVERELADVVQEEPLTARLRFEPRGRGHADDQFYLADKVNRCCACGDEGEYLRCNVVPHCYRSQFPVHMKSHLSHDVVLLCRTCQQVYSTASHVRMAALGREHNAPLDREALKYDTDAGEISVRSAARALANTKAALPPERRAKLEAILLVHFGVAALTPELLENAGQLECKTPSPEWKSHASVVVGALDARGIDALVRGFRQLFLDVLRPKYLPPHWSVDSRVANSSVTEAANGNGHAAAVP